MKKYFGENSFEKKPFTYEKQFPEVFNRKNPGFDVIIGNPPYVRIQTLPRDEVKYFSDKYKSAKGSYDIYLLFIERAYRLLRKGGVAGFILPNKFMVSGYGERLRELLSRERAVWKMVDFGDAQVFEGATTYTMLLFLQKAENKEVIYISASDYLKQNQRPNLDMLETQAVKINYEKLTANPWSFATSKHSKLLEKIEKGKTRFGELMDKMFQGIITGADKIYILHKATHESRHSALDAESSPFPLDSCLRRNDRTKAKDETITLYSPALERAITLEKEIVHPLLKGSLDMRRYYTEKITRYVLFPYKNGKLIPQEDFERLYPYCWQYLLENRATLSNREKGKMKHLGWYGFSRPQNLDKFEMFKILTPSIAKQASFTYDKGGEYYFVGSGGGGGGGYGIIMKGDVRLSPLYILALLNSRLLDFYLQNISSPFRHGYYAYNKQYIEQLPIKLLNISNSAEKSRHDELVSIADKMLKLHKELQKVSENTDKWYALKRESEQTNNVIDERVYRLYGLTADEIKIIEGNVDD